MNVQLNCTRFSLWWSLSATRPPRVGDGCIDGLEAARLADEKRARLSLVPSESGDKQLDEPMRSSPVEFAKKAPPRLRQPARSRQVVPAPRAELQAHKAAFRELFGDTLSDEFVDEMLTRLDWTLAPGPWDE